MATTLLAVDAMDKTSSETQLSPSKKLQHAILQLCNEYVAYDRTLQVLGVICLTIDDQHPEIVVKVNNTLKRFKDTESLPLINSLQKADAKVARLLNLTSPASPHPTQQDADQSNSGSKVSNYAGEGKTRLHGFGARSKTGLKSVKVVRKGHGRKQSNPLKVSHSQVEFADENSSSDNLVIDMPKEEAGVQSPYAEDLVEIQKEMDQGITEASQEDEGNEDDECRRKRTFDSNSDVEERVPKMTRLREIIETNHQRDDSQTTAELDQEMFLEESEDLKRLVIIEPLDVPPELIDETNNVLNAATSLEEYDPTGEIDADIIHIKEELESGDDDHSTTTQLEKLLKADKPKQRQKNVLEASQYSVGLKANTTAAVPIARQVLPAPSTLVPNQIFAILPNATSVQQPQTQTSGLARLLQPTTFYTITDKSLQNCNNNCFSLQLTQMAKNVLRLPTDGSQTSNNQVSFLGNLNVATSQNNLAGSSTSVITLNKNQNLESDFLVDSFADEPELLAKIGLKSSSLVSVTTPTGKTHRRRVCDDVLTPEEIIEYVGSTDPSKSSTALQRPYKCSCCDETLHNLMEYFRHTLRVHNAFVCHQCGKDFTTKSSLLRHRPIHTGLRRFACGICRKAFYRKDKCKAHIKMHLRFNQLSSVGGSTSGNGSGNSATKDGKAHGKMHAGLNKGASSSGTGGVTASKTAAPQSLAAITTQLVGLPTFVVPGPDGT